MSKFRGRFESGRFVRSEGDSKSMATKKSLAHGTPAAPTFRVPGQAEYAPQGPGEKKRINPATSLPFGNADPLNPNRGKQEQTTDGLSKEPLRMKAAKPYKTHR